MDFSRSDWFVVFFPSPFLSTVQREQGLHMALSRGERRKAKVKGMLRSDSKGRRFVTERGGDEVMQHAGIVEDRQTRQQQNRRNEGSKTEPA